MSAPIDPLDELLGALGLPEDATPITPASAILARAERDAPAVAVAPAGLAGWKAVTVLAGAIAAGLFGGIVVHDARSPPPVRVARIETLAVAPPPVGAPPLAPPREPAPVRVARAPVHAVVVLDAEALPPSPACETHALADVDEPDAPVVVEHAAAPRVADALFVAAGGAAVPDPADPRARRGGLVAAVTASRTVLDGALADVDLRVGADALYAPAPDGPRWSVGARVGAEVAFGEARLVPSVGWLAGVRADDALDGARFFTGPTAALTLGDPDEARLRAELDLDGEIPRAGAPIVVRPALILGVTIPLS
ncbi:MAG: hypothetical protein ACOZNI_36145 [Myxococcota bacterium]